MASPTQMHNVLCRSVTIEAMFTASNRSSGSHRDWPHLHGGIWREFGDDRNRWVFGMQTPGMVLPPVDGQVTPQPAVY
jgi:hypothetical protein